MGMVQAVRATRGMAVAPHALAAESALDILRAGGNAIEATIAAAATIAVVYPHMNSLGGDGFWTISHPGQPVTTIEACGGAAGRASAEYYTAKGYNKIPPRGPDAANTVAGTVGGWQAALEVGHEWGGTLPLGRLLESAIFYARDGIPVSHSQSATTTRKLGELESVSGFSETFLVAGKAPEPGARFKQERIAQTLKTLANEGLDGFYRGPLAARIAKDLRALGSPISTQDLANYRATRREPLVLEHSLGTIYNTQPPTQGLVSLIILGLLDRLDIGGLDPESAEYVHLVVEATKQAFLIRDRVITDLAYMKTDPQTFLAGAALDSLVKAIDPGKASPWGTARAPSDTVWVGVVDQEGRAVSFIQSLYHEYGSGLVLPDTGINWQNRGCSFSLDPAHVNALRPNKKPFHTLNPALARLNDGRTMVYGTMGGDGQPQTQAAVFTRYAIYRENMQAAISAPRWLLGRTWGDDSTSLKLESRFPEGTVRRLKELGHPVELVQEFDDVMGHAGGIVRRADGVLEGGSDPRSDGGVAAF